MSAKLRAPKRIWNINLLGVKLLSTSVFNWSARWRIVVAIWLTDFHVNQVCSGDALDQRPGYISHTSTWHCMDCKSWAARWSSTFGWQEVEYWIRELEVFTSDLEVKAPFWIGDESCRVGIAITSTLISDNREVREVWREVREVSWAGEDISLTRSQSASS